MSEVSLPLIPYAMQVKSMEVLSLEARNGHLKYNIDALEIENAKLKSEASSPVEERGEFTKKIEEIEHENNELYTNLLSLKKKHAKLLLELNEVKLEKKGRDEKVLGLEKKVESQKLELARAYDEIKTLKENEQSENTSAERHSKSRMEIKELESIIKNLETQNINYKTQLNQKEKKCQTQHHHNEKFVSSTSLRKFFLNLKQKLQRMNKVRELTKE